MKIMIGIPAGATVSTPFFASAIGLKYGNGHSFSYSVKEGSLVYQNRNLIAMEAIQGDFTHIIFIDSDMVFEPDTVLKLAEDAKNKDYVTGVCFKRKIPTEPVILKALEWAQTTEGFKDDVVVYEDYPKDSVFEIMGSGLACCIVSVEMIKHIASAFRQGPFDPLPRLSEDYAFCWRARQLGYKLWCDGRIKPGHAGIYIFSEDDWRKGE